MRIANGADHRIPGVIGCESKSFATAAYHHQLAMNRAGYCIADLYFLGVRWPNYCELPTASRLVGNIWRIDVPDGSGWLIFARLSYTSAHLSSPPYLMYVLSVLRFYTAVDTEYHHRQPHASKS
jgi:hypothetical protein